MREDFADRNKIKKTARQGRIIRFCQVVFFEHDIMLLCSYCYNVGEKGGGELSREWSFGNISSARQPSVEIVTAVV